MAIVSARRRSTRRQNTRRQRTRRQNTRRQRTRHTYHHQRGGRPSSYDTLSTSDKNEVDEIMQELTDMDNKKEKLISNIVKTDRISDGEKQQIIAPISNANTKEQLTATTHKWIKKRQQLFPTEQPDPRLATHNAMKDASSSLNKGNIHTATSTEYKMQKLKDLQEKYPASKLLEGKQSARRFSRNFEDETVSPEQRDAHAISKKNNKRVSFNQQTQESLLDISKSTKNSDPDPATTGAFTSHDNNAYNSIHDGVSMPTYKPLQTGKDSRGKTAPLTSLLRKGSIKRRKTIEEVRKNSRSRLSHQPSRGQWGSDRFNRPSGYIHGE